MGATSGAGTAYPSAAPEFIYVFSGIRDTQSLVLFVWFVDRCFSFCPFSFGHCVVCSSVFWPLCCLFFDIRILITPLVSSNSSWYSLFFWHFDIPMVTVDQFCFVCLFVSFFFVIFQ